MNTITMPPRPGRLTERRAMPEPAGQPDGEWEAVLNRHMAVRPDVVQAFENMIDDVFSATPNGDVAVTLTKGQWYGLISAITALEVRRSALLELASSKRRALEQRVAALEAKPTTGVRYAGIWTENSAYTEGDLVTDRGSLWLARGATERRPGGPPWQLIVKSGTAR